MRSMQCQLGMLKTISAFAYRHRETKKNLCRGGVYYDSSHSASVQFLSLCFNVLYIIDYWFSFVVMMFCFRTIYVIFKNSQITEDHLMSSDSQRINRDVTTSRDDSDPTTGEMAFGSAVNDDRLSPLREAVILLKEIPSTTTKAGNW